LLCYRCGTHVVDTAEHCTNCGQELSAGSLRHSTGTFSRRRMPSGQFEGAPYQAQDLVANRYLIKEPVGTGPLGYVFRAHDKELDLEVALKVVNPRLCQTPEERKQFAKQLKNARRLSHPNLVRVYEEGEDGDRPFFTSQYLDGLSLRKIIDLRLQKMQYFSIIEIEPILAQVCSALMGAHKVGPHSDIKPENILVLPDLLKVTDFSLGLAMPRLPFIQAMKAKKSDRYLAPEFVDGGEFDFRADIYSMGVILGEMAAGAFPDGSIPELSVLNPSVTPGLENLYRRAVHANATARLKTPEEFLSELMALAQTARASLPPSVPKLESVMIPGGRPRTVTGLLHAQPRPKPPPPVPSLSPTPPARALESGKGSGQTGEAGFSAEPGLASSSERSRQAEPGRGAEPGLASSSERNRQPEPGRGAAVNESILGDPLQPEMTQPIDPVALARALKGSDLSPGAALDAVKDREETQVLDSGIFISKIESEASPVRPQIVLSSQPAPFASFAKSSEEKSPLLWVSILVFLGVTVGVGGAYFYIQSQKPDHETAARESPDASVVNSIEKATAIEKSEIERIAAERIAAMEKAAAVKAAADKAVADRKAPAEKLKNEKPIVSEKAISPISAGEKCATGMHYFSAGSFKMGTAPGDPMMGFDEKTLGSVSVNAFCVDLYEFPNKRGGAPVAAVTFSDAQHLCEAAGKRLCTESEWEKACKGPGLFRWTYGNTFDSKACNNEDEGGDTRTLATSGRFPKCHSTTGVFDLSGNVAEWTSERVVKGGSFASADYAVRCAARKNGATKSPEIGFRCCTDAK
jgi:eukaryotic-like serine/threonine-protein kinase